MSLNIARNIQPVSEFRKRSSEYLEELKRTREWLVLTQHGKSTAVVVDVNEFQRILDRIEFLEGMVNAHRAIEHGDVVPQEQAVSEIREHIAPWK